MSDPATQALLERIANALERIAPPAPAESKMEEKVENKISNIQT